MKLKNIILILIFLLLIVASLFVLVIQDLIKNIPSKNNFSVHKNNNSSTNIISEKLNLSSNNEIESAGSGSSSGRLGTSVGGFSSSGENLPDIASNPCGYYYEEYGICNGTCPNGICVSEKRSCYCKET